MIVYFYVPPSTLHIKKIQFHQIQYANTPVRQPVPPKSRLGVTKADTPKTFVYGKADLL